MVAFIAVAGFVLIGIYISMSIWQEIVDDPWILMVPIWIGCCIASLLHY